MDYRFISEEVKKCAEKYKEDMSEFLREIIAIPCESCNEEIKILRIKKEMEKVGFDKVEIDPMGNILAYIGTGSHLIAMDGHVDTVGIGDPSLWNYNPYEGDEDEEVILGRGTSDQGGGIAAMVYAGKIIKELNLEDDYTLLITCTVQEEDCDGLCWQYIINEDNIRPEFVVVTEPTGCNIYRGHRGRMEIKISTSGLSCHGSAPERGENAIFKMAPILNELKELDEKLIDNDFLGKGTVTVSEIFYSSPSRCAVPDGCSISIDRRLTYGETYEFALEQIRNLDSIKKNNAKVTMYDYSKKSYTGLVYKTKAYFPTWVIPEEHNVCQSLIDTYQMLFKTDPIVDKWTFSTNGVSIMGRYNIPCIGFGPGHEEQAHSPNERTWKSEIVKAAAMYSLIPLIYLDKIKKRQ
ncbi:YgeY family selenium metabolism-linked hydrolase [Clostridium sp. AL.422]|uniref:YgeY family selenium metabolism-linked hydrolase n=1 Tax=Clostridium TaxID=1485 RepID=UPI00293DB293|nr:MULTISPECIES: YgeY family selenium metabolism-linked hydrolase [unclassified Clostridium]MDV4151294.1 YgeY family selenium metabolism-linked hydrolase [Clostridium sp. AL.422]